MLYMSFFWMSTIPTLSFKVKLFLHCSEKVILFMNLIVQKSYFFVRCFQLCILTEKELFNVHSLLHLADGIKNLGPLWTHSCFPTESYNGNLLKIFHRTQNVELQIISALAISQSLPNLKSELIPGSVEEEFLYSRESISWQ